jgi:hypothetical protein
MVEPAESREGLNLAFTRSANFCRPTCWRVLRESKMSSVLVKTLRLGRIARICAAVCRAMLLAVAAQSKERRDFASHGSAGSYAGRGR